MPKEQEDQIFQFILTVLSVKMKVKFPCKMTLEQAGRTLTTQVYSNEEGRFVFNQEVRLRQQSQKLFTQLNICLITEKGARYISGIIKLYHNEILRSEGERIVATLSKCLDTQSFCQLRVDKVIREGPAKPRTLTTIPGRTQKFASPRHTEEINQNTTDFKSPRKSQAQQIGLQSKSQSHFQVTGNLRIGSRQDELRARDYAAMTGNGNNYRNGNHQPKGRSKPYNSKNKYQPLQYNADFQREKVLQGQVYRENYQKLKQKYLKQVQASKNQLNKRLTLENKQKDFKLQILRLKLKTDELQKAVIQKNLKLKELTLTLSALQGFESEVNLLREDLANKQHAINIMDDTIITLSKENDQLRLASKQSFYKLQQRIMILENELEIADAKSTAKKEELQRQIRNLQQMLVQKDAEINRKTAMLEKEKKSIYQLEKSLQCKLFQYDSQLQNQRELCKQRVEESRLKIQQAFQKNQRLNLQKSELSSQIDKLKSLLLKNEYQFKLYHQQTSSLKAQIQELRLIKDKYNEMAKQIRSLGEQKIILERNHQKIVVSKQNTIQSVTTEYKRQIESLKKLSKQLQDKSKLLSNKLIQSQSQLEISKSGLQKLKKNHENTNKELIDLKQREKQLKKSLKSKQQQIQDARKELNRIKQKNQSLIESAKNQLSKTRDQLSRIKIQLQSQAGKNQQLVQTNSDLTLELARIKMSQQFSEQKCDKLSQSAQEKYAQFEKIIKQHQSVIQLFEEKIRVQKGNQKDLCIKLQRYEYQLNLTFEKNEKLIKEFRILQQKNKQAQIALKTKQAQLTEAVKKISELEQRIEAVQQEKKQLKDQLQFNHNQLQKSKRMVEILQKDYEKAKIDIISYCQKLNERQKELDDKISDCKREKDNCLSIQSKYNSLKKEHEKFKESISQALANSFAQAIQTFSSTEKYQKVKSSNYNDSSILFLKRGILDLNNDLANAIASAGKQNKVQNQKLNQKIRGLQRDIDLLKSQLERNQQSSRKQINQKAREIEQLEQELRLIKSEKGEAQVQNHLTVQQFQQEVNHYKSQCQILISTKDELQFSLGSLRMQVERLSEEYKNKEYVYQNLKNQLFQKIQFQCHNTELAQKRAHDMEYELMNLKQILLRQKEQIYKKQEQFAESEQSNQKVIKQLQSLKKLMKQLEQRYTELEIQFTTMKQIKEKYERELNQEESKLKEVRIFNTKIMKEKEEIIKKELEKNLQVTQLQNTIADLRHSLQQEVELKTKFKSDFEEARELTKKYLTQIRDIQDVLAQQKTKYNQVRDKLRQKQHLLTEIKEQSVSIKTRLQQNLKKGKATSEQLEIENNKLFKQIQIIKIQSHQQISILQAQLSRANQQIQSNKEEISELQQALFVERQNNNSTYQNINKLKQEIQDFRKKLQEMEKAYVELTEQNRQKDENMFQMGGKLYEYQTRMRQMQEQKLREIEQLNNSLSVKYDQDYQEINQKIQLIQKEKEYFKEKYNQKEQEVVKKYEEIKHHQIEQMEFKKMYQEKIKKLQEEKLAIFTDKNKEIAKALDQNKAQFQVLRTKQAQLRKVIHELQISRNTIQKMEGKLKEMQGQKQNQIKAYQTQIQNLRKKDLLFKNFKDTVKSNQWSCQREVRKQTQNLIKKWLQGGEKQVRNETLISLIKGMEQSLLSAISNVSKDLQ